MAKSDYEILKEIHQLDPRVVIVIDVAVGLVDRETAHVQALAELLLPKVEKDALASL